MTPKERMLAALSFKQPDDIVPLWEIEFHIFKELMGRGLILGYEFDALADWKKRDAVQYNADIIAETSERCDFAAITAMGSYWEQGPGEPAYYWIGSADWRLEHIRALRNRFGQQRMIVGFSGSNVGIPMGQNMLTFIYQMEDRPDEILELNEKYLVDGIEEGDMMLQAGADALCNACDIAFNSGTFFSPAQLDKYIFPYFKQWNSVFRKKGIPTILHTDGNVGAILEDIITCGFTALQCIDPIAGMNIIDTKARTYGRLALIGNVNVSTLQMGTREQIETHIKALLEGCKPGGGFVLGCCNAVFQGIPVENYLLMLQCRDRYGRYG